MRELFRYLQDVEGLNGGDNRAVRILSYLQTRYRPDASVNNGTAYRESLARNTLKSQEQKFHSLTPEKAFPEESFSEKVFPEKVFQEKVFQKTPLESMVPDDNKMGWLAHPVTSSRVVVSGSAPLKYSYAGEPPKDASVNGART